MSSQMDRIREREEATVAELDQIAEPNLRRVDLADIATAKIAPVTFAIDLIIPAREVTLFGSHGGAGKTMLALIWCAHVAAGRDWAGLRVMQGKATFLSFEDEGDRIRTRLQRILKAYAIDAEAVAANLRIFDVPRGDTFLMAEPEFGELVDAPLFAQVREAVAGSQLIVVDNASESFGGNENQRRQVRKFVRSLAHMARVNDAGVVLLAHIDKAGAKFGSAGNSYTGSTAWHNSARSRVALVRDGDDVLTLRHEKHNFSAAAPDIPLHFDANFTLTPGEGAQVMPDDDDALIAAFSEANTMGIDVPFATTGPRTAWHVLKAVPAMPKRYATKSGKSAMDSTMMRLIKARRLAVEEFKKPDRHTGKRVVLPQHTTAARAYTAASKGE